MPHAFVNTRINPFDLVLKWQKQTFHVEDIRVKIQKGFGRPGASCSLFPCFVIERHKKQFFYVETQQKGENRLVIRLDPATRVARTVGVRLALAWFSRNLINFDQNAQVDGGNLDEYFELLNIEPLLQAAELKRLQKKLSAKIRVTDLRCQAERFNLSIENLKLPIKWQEIYDNNNQVEIEIGPGKGKYLLNEAKNHPDKNYLAIEWAGRYLKILMERLSKSEVTNLRLIHGDARTIIRDWIPQASVSKISILYPDPWWKNKHQKHKLFSTEFLLNLEKILISNGVFLFATDVVDLYRSLEELMKFTQLTRVNQKEFISGKEPPPGRSNFEIKKWRGGSNIYEATWQKNGLQ